MKTAIEQFSFLAVSKIQDLEISRANKVKNAVKVNKRWDGRVHGEVVAVWFFTTGPVPKIVRFCWRASWVRSWERKVKRFIIWIERLSYLAGIFQILTLKCRGVRSIPWLLLPSVHNGFVFKMGRMTEEKGTMVVHKRGRNFSPDKSKAHGEFEKVNLVFVSGWSRWFPSLVCGHWDNLSGALPKGDRENSDLTDSTTWPRGPPTIFSLSKATTVS